MKQASSSNSLHVYCSNLSPFGIGVALLLKANNIPHEKIIIDTLKGENKTEEYKKINPLQKVPAIIDGDLTLFESNTIMRYLCNSKQVDEHWYPKDPKKRALVDLYFDWHAANITNFTTLVYVKFGMSKVDPEEARALNEKTQKEIESVFLSQRKYLASDDKITIADLALASRFASSAVYGIDLIPRLQEYFNNVNEVPEVKEIVEKYIQDGKEVLAIMTAAKTESQATN